MRNPIAVGRALALPQLTARLAAVSIAAFLFAAPAWAQTAPSLGAASGFAVLGNTAVTCTSSVVIGDVGISSGNTAAFTNTGCSIAGGMPPATNTAAFQANSGLIAAYNTLKFNTPCTGTLPSTITGPVTLTPGVYCTGAALTGTGVLTLDARGNANAVWIFKIGAALTGTNFSVVMANGGKACNVFWAPSAAVTMTTSAFSGNILAGDAVGGSITLTGGTLVGRALANVAVTMTTTTAGVGAGVIGCGAPGAAALSSSLSSLSSLSCKGNDRDGDDEDKDHKKCNQGVGNGSEGCDPGHSDEHKGSNDEHGDKPGDPGRKGGKS